MSFGSLEDKRVNIIIVGSGKVGYTLAQHLNAEGHEITVIDSDEEKIKDLSSEMDIYCVLGNGTSYRTQKEAGIEKADLLISVANQDEVNLLSCLIAKKAGNCQTIARVRNPEYYDEIGYIREELGLSMSINPEWEAANEMARLIQYPSALAVEKFRGGMTLLRVVIPEKSVLNGMSVAEFAVKISRQILVCIVKRGKEIRIPDGNFVLMAGDAISVSLLQTVRSGSSVLSLPCWFRYPCCISVCICELRPQTYSLSPSKGFWHAQARLSQRMNAPSASLCASCVGA